MAVGDSRVVCGGPELRAPGRGGHLGDHRARLGRVVVSAPAGFSGRLGRPTASSSRRRRLLARSGRGRLLLRLGIRLRLRAREQRVGPDLLDGAARLAQRLLEQLGRLLHDGLLLLRRPSASGFASGTSRRRPWSRVPRRRPSQARARVPRPFRPRGVRCGRRHDARGPSWWPCAARGRPWPPAPRRSAWPLRPREQAQALARAPAARPPSASPTRPRRPCRRPPSC